MVTTNGNDRHLSSGGGPGKDTVVPEIPRGLACDGLQPTLPDGFVAVARCMVKLGRMAEVNAALLAAIEPASATSVRKWRDWQPPPDRQTAGEHSVSA